MLIVVIWVARDLGSFVVLQKIWKCVLQSFGNTLDIWKAIHLEWCSFGNGEVSRVFIDCGAGAVGLESSWRLWKSAFFPFAAVLGWNPSLCMCQAGFLTAVPPASAFWTEECEGQVPRCTWFKACFGVCWDFSSTVLAWRAGLWVPAPAMYQTKAEKWFL